MNVLVKGWFSEISDELWPGQCFSLKVKSVLHEETSDFQDIKILDTWVFEEFVRNLNFDLPGILSLRKWNVRPSSYLRWGDSVHWTRRVWLSGVDFTDPTLQSSQPWKGFDCRRRRWRSCERSKLKNLEREESHLNLCILSGFETSACEGSPSSRNRWASRWSLKEIFAIHGLRLWFTKSSSDHRRWVRVHEKSPSRVRCHYHRLEWSDW